MKHKGSTVPTTKPGHKNAPNVIPTNPKSCDSGGYPELSKAAAALNSPKKGGAPGV